MNNENTQIPNKAFDLEYSTQFRKEMEYLKQHNVHPTYVTKTKPYNITVYKYTKTPELFSLLTTFYAEETLLKKFKKAIAEASTIEEIDLSMLCARGDSHGTKNNV